MADQGLRYDIDVRIYGQDAEGRREDACRLELEGPADTYEDALRVVAAHVAVLERFASAAVNRPRCIDCRTLPATHPGGVCDECAAVRNAQSEQASGQRKAEQAPSEE